MSKTQDLTGMKINDLEVVEYIGNKKWKCKCSCGNFTIKNTYNLTTGVSKCCEKCTADKLRKQKEEPKIRKNTPKDLKGLKFGKLEVLGYAGNYYWTCKCECGTIKNILGYSLIKGDSTSCGCNKTELKYDLTGKKIGEWNVIRYIGHQHWECQCSCGKVASISSYGLRNGMTKSCGHDKYKLINDLIGKRFGMLTVEEYLGNCKYKCKCDCGKYVEVLSSNLKEVNGTESCGCKNKSIYTKEYLSNIIDKYTKENGYEPFTDDIAKELGLNTGYLRTLITKFGLRYKLNKYFKSRYEKDIYEYIRSINSKLKIESNVKYKLDNKLELDIYIEELKLAIEFNGDFWHSEQFKPKNYHQNKTINCAMHGIHLIQIFQHEWEDADTQRKIKQLIKNKIVNDKKIIYARECTVEKIRKDIEEEFLTKYHLQGYTQSKIAYGLFKDKKLVSIMTFGTPRFSNKYEWEIIRYCTDAENAVVGGIEKLFKAFINNNNPSSVISYCDISKFNGNVYTKIGFKATNKDITAPNYKWIKYNSINDIRIVERYQSQKQKLLDMGLGIYGDTEVEIMETLGYYRVYDCGNLRLTWTKKQVS